MVIHLCQRIYIVLVVVVNLLMQLMALLTHKNLRHRIIMWINNEMISTDVQIEPVENVRCLTSEDKFRKLLHLRQDAKRLKLMWIHSNLFYCKIREFVPRQYYRNYFILLSGVTG